MRKAKAELEAEAGEKAAEHARAKEQRKAERRGDDPDDQGTVAKIEQAAAEAAASATPKPKAQRNFTDPASRIMRTSDGSFHRCYNAQAVVDEAHQVIVATALTNQAADAPHLPSMLDATLANVGMPARFLADADYWSDVNNQQLVDAQVDGYIATGRLKHGESPPLAPRGRIPGGATPKQRMARKLRAKKGRAIYARRKVIPEPVFGPMKTLQGAGQLLLRGQQAASTEWMLHATVHNLRKLYTQRDKLPAVGPESSPGSAPDPGSGLGGHLRQLCQSLTPTPQRHDPTVSIFTDHQHSHALIVGCYRPTRLVVATARDGVPGQSQLQCTPSAHRDITARQEKRACAAQLSGT